MQARRQCGVSRQWRQPGGASSTLVNDSILLPRLPVFLRLSLKGSSVLTGSVRSGDDDDDIYIYIYIYTVSCCFA